MENVKMFRNSPTYGFKKGDEFKVLRTINGECVVIRNEPTIPNLIFTERKLRSYGYLTGKPQIGG